MLCSLDTNILPYAANRDCPEHPLCHTLLRRAMNEAARWILSDQVLFELYRALRNLRILAKPLSASAAAQYVSMLREKTGVMQCWYDGDCWTESIARLERRDFPYQRTHDTVLAATLLNQGVTTFYTRNTKDFRHAGFERLIDPLAGSVS
jgi:toxin-antitoxin system PIN domain toxin